MAATYKVWIHVERCDEEKDTYDDLDVSFGAVKEFDSEDDAIRVRQPAAGHGGGTVNTKAPKPCIVLQITSSWCIDAYVSKLRPFELVSSPKQAKRFAHADVALKAGQRYIPSPIASFAPATTFKLVRVED